MLLHSRYGIINNTDGTYGWDTYEVSPTTETDFVGLSYFDPEAADPNAYYFDYICVDLCQQFGDGGNWAATPSLYLLKTPVDTNRTEPQTDLVNWELVADAELVTTAAFGSAPDDNPSPVTPIIFRLTEIADLDARSGYGWAVGGVAGDGNFQFLSISELRGYGGLNPDYTIPLPTCQEQGVYMSMDFNQDCYVDLEDFAVFAADWLKCNDPQNFDCTAIVQ